MPVLNIIQDGDNCWPDLPEKEVLNLMHTNAPPISLAALPGGMQSGRTSISIRIDLPDGRVLLTETSLRLLQVACRAFTARFGDQSGDLEGDGSRLA